MKVLVKDLKPNPYRDMEHYPIDKDKIQSLKDSIEQTEFWDNILARRKGKEYQIAYGHHRLTALQELGIDMVDIPIKDLDDATMIQIMANENMDDWKTSPSVLIETVKVTKQFLDAELATYNTWEVFNKTALINKNGFREINSKASFASVKSQGVGAPTITNFLGKGWESKKWAVSEALKTLTMIKNDEVSEEAIKELPSIHHMRSFTKGVKETPISKTEQVQYAKEIKEKDISKREMDYFFIDKRFQSPKKKIEKQDEKIKKFEDIIAETTRTADSLGEQLKMIIRYKEEFDNEYYNKTIQKYRLLLSIKYLQNQFNLITNSKNDYEKESSFNEKSPLSISE